MEWLQGVHHTASNEGIAANTTTVLKMFDKTHFKHCYSKSQNNKTLDTYSGHA